MMMITKRELQPLVSGGLSQQQIADELGTTKSRVRHSMDHHRLKTYRSSLVERPCVICGTQTNREKFCSTRCRKNNTYLLKKQQAVELKRLIVIERGGCKECGYMKNLASLAFHHRDEQQKEFVIGQRELINFGRARIEQELEKCDLLCHNCHHELHYPELRIGLEGNTFWWCETHEYPAPPAWTYCTRGPECGGEKKCVVVASRDR